MSRGMRRGLVTTAGAAVVAFVAMSAMGGVKRSGEQAKGPRRQPTPVANLYPAGHIEFSAPPPISVAVGTQCDTDGNIYLRIGPPYEVASQFIRDHIPLSIPLTKLVIDSRTTVTFRAGSAQGYTRFNSVAFYVTPSGRVYNLGSACRQGTDCKKRRDEVWVVTKYDHDGSVDSVVRLRAHTPEGESLILVHLAAFQNGNLLAAGETESSDGELKPFTGVFYGDGGFLSNLTLPHDVSVPHLAVEEGSVGKATRPRPSARTESKGARAFVQFDRAVVEGLLIGSPDGTIYLLRGGSPARLYVVASDGGVLREQDIKTPRSGLTPFSASVNGQGQLVIFYIHLPSPRDSGQYQALALVDPQSGKVIATYKVPPRAGVPACMTSQGVFLFTREGKSGHLEVAQYTVGQ